MTVVHSGGSSAPPVTAATISDSRCRLCSGNFSSAACKRIRFSCGLSLAFETAISCSSSAVSSRFAGTAAALAGTAALVVAALLLAGAGTLAKTSLLVGREPLHAQVKSNTLEPAARHQHLARLAIALDRAS